MTENDVRAATESWLAENRMREVQDYISRGRSLEHTSIDELAGEWVSLIRAWAADLRHAHDRRRADIEAEYQLRGLGSGPINLASAFGSNCHEASLDERTSTGNFALEASFQEELSGAVSSAVRRLIRVRRYE